MGFDKLSPNGVGWLSPNGQFPFALGRGLSVSKALCRREGVTQCTGFDKLSPNGVVLLSPNGVVWLSLNGVVWLSPIEEVVHLRPSLCSVPPAARRTGRTRRPAPG
jgi:hypothetical protein